MDIIHVGFCPINNLTFVFLECSYLFCYKQILQVIKFYHNQHLQKIDAIGC